jgi:GNAT superfamily N-acetyltransferase
MDKPIVYRDMKRGEEGLVFTFVSGVFNEFVAPQYSQEGVEEFMKYIQPEELSSRTQGNHFSLIAELDSEIVGVIEIRNYSHVALLFVDSRFQRKGVGRELLRKAMEICRRNELSLSQVTVNASPNSVTAYERMGFKPTDAEQCVNGIRFVPMALRLVQEDGG